MHYQEAVNHAKAFDYIIDILKSGKKINENTVLEIHKRLLSGIASRVDFSLPTFFG